MDEHSPHLDRLAHPPQPAYQARCGAPAGTGFGVQRRQVACAETDEGVSLIQQGDDDFSLLSVPQRFTGIDIDDLDDDVMREVPLFTFATRKA